MFSFLNYFNILPIISLLLLIFNIKILMLCIKFNFKYTWCIVMTFKSKILYGKKTHNVELLSY